MELGIVGTVLGVAIGFVVVMLFLSFVVTGVGQGVQALLQLRGRATRSVLTERLEAMKPREARALVEKHIPLRKILNPSRLEPVARFVNWLAGPADRVVHAAELKELGFQSAEERRHFDAAVTERFTSWMRLVTMACAIGIACSFQVSATELVKSLSTDRALLHKALDAAERAEHAEAKTRAATTSFAEISETALAQVAKEQPGIADELEEMSGRAVDKGDASSELALVLEGHPARDTVLARYDELVASGIEERASKARDLRKEGENELALLDITFWRRGTAFFYAPPKQGIPDMSGAWLWGNIIGVLLTGLLLTFGAPFWYERLRDLKVLRDSLYTRPGPNGAAAVLEQRDGASPKPVIRQ